MATKKEIDAAAKALSENVYQHQHSSTRNYRLIRREAEVAVKAAEAVR